MKDFIVLDIETTGLSPKNCEITEIGAIKVCGTTLEVKETFESMIDIDGNVPFSTTNLNGITKEMLNRKGRPISEVLLELSTFITDLDIYAHNSSFDERFIKHFVALHNIKHTPSKWINTISIFKKYMPGRKTYKLESLIIEFGLAEKEDHRAISDAMHTLKLLKKCKR